MSEAEASLQRERGSKGGFLTGLAGLGAFAGLAMFAWALIDSMNPSAEALNPTVSVDLNTIPLGQRKTVYWRDSIPVFIVHRTTEQIARVRADDATEMPFPELDRDRVQRAEWLVVVGTCFQAIGQKPGENAGKWDGWYCPYRDRYFDLSGRLRSKWGGRNLEVPPYYFQDDRWLIIGDNP